MSYVKRIACDSDCEDLYNSFPVGTLQFSEISSLITQIVNYLCSYLDLNHVESF